METTEDQKKRILRELAEKYQDQFPKPDEITTEDLANLLYGKGHSRAERQAVKMYLDGKVERGELAARDGTANGHNVRIYRRVE